MTSTCSSDDESTVRRRRAEELTIQELEAKRQASRQRVWNVWDSLEKRYSRPIEDDDIVDLESLTLLQDAGTLRKMQDAPYGSLSLATGDSEDEEDELAVWDDEHSAEATLHRGKSHLSEEELRDFLRAERLRREAQGEVDDSGNDEESRVVQQRDEQGEEQQESEEQQDESEEEENETTDEEENFERQEATSVSSRQSATEERETDSEDELGAEPLESTLQKEIYYSSRDEPSENDETNVSSEDELAASDDGYVEYVRPIKQTDSAPPKPVEKTRETHRNPQLSTPPLSKSSVLSSTPEASGSRILWKPRASSVLPPKMRTGEFHQPTRGESVRPPVRRPSIPPPRPQSLLGKRKLSPPMYRYAEEPVDSPPCLPLVGTSSSRNIGPERRTKSQNERHPQQRLARTDGSLTRHISQSPEKWSRDEPSDQLHDIITPSDLSQLVYHLREVNEWVKAHQIADFDFGDHTSQSSSYPTPHRPSRVSVSSYLTPPHVASRRNAYPSSVVSQSASSTAGPPSTPAHLFDSSPIKSKLQNKNDGARLTTPRKPDTTSESPSNRSHGHEYRQAEGSRRLHDGLRSQSSRPRKQNKVGGGHGIPSRRQSADVKLDRDDFFSPQVLLDRSRQNVHRSVRPRLY